jgi:hypothetical protein
VFRVQSLHPFAANDLRISWLNSGLASWVLAFGLLSAIGAHPGPSVVKTPGLCGLALFRLRIASTQQAAVESNEEVVRVFSDRQASLNFAKRLDCVRFTAAVFSAYPPSPNGEAVLKHPQSRCQRDEPAPQVGGQVGDRRRSQESGARMKKNTENCTTFIFLRNSATHGAHFAPQIPQYVPNSLCFCPFLLNSLHGLASQFGRLVPNLGANKKL